MTRSKIKNYIGEGRRFVFCFQLKFPHNEIKYFTSSDLKIIKDHIKYEPYSGLAVKEGNFNDSAQDEVRITGVFESKGIDKNTALDATRMVVLFYFFDSQELLEWIDYSFDKIISNGMKFEITLRPDTVKWQKSILKTFSTTCRAIFGDQDCRVEKVLYSGIYTANRIDGNIVNIENCNKGNGFFTGGQLTSVTGKVYEVKTHHNNTLTLSRYCDEKAPQRVVLTPGCNKKFITCCNIYNNAINFRGEPLIPWKVP